MYNYITNAYLVLITGTAITCYRQMRFLIIPFTMSLICFSLPSNAITIKDIITKEAIKQGVPVGVAIAVAKVESSLNPNAINYEANRNQFSIGLFQVMQSTAKWFCNLNTMEELLNIMNNVRCGISYLRSQMERYKDIDKAILSYNSGSYIENRNGVPVNVGYLNKIKEKLNESINLNITDLYGIMRYQDQSREGKAFSPNYYRF